jgi:hypothetical protein
VIEYARLLEQPPRLPQHRRRRFRLRQGEPMCFGAMTLTLLCDTVDGEQLSPHYIVEWNGRSGRLPAAQAMTVPGIAGATLVPLAVCVRLHQPGVREYSVVIELRAETEAAVRGIAA